MLKVFKYEIEASGNFVLELPVGAEILKVENQHGNPCMWALVDPNAATRPRKFIFRGTGHPIEHDYGQLKFISTFQVQGGSFIFHIFEVL